MRWMMMVVLALVACAPAPIYQRAPGNDASDEQLQRDNAACKAQAAGIPYSGSGAVDYVNISSFLTNCMRAKGYVRTN